MRLFGALYDKVLRWSQHPRAPVYLGAVSFMESSFFPIPVAFMLAPMAVAKPELALRYAGIATITSVLGGLFGYLIGYYAFSWVEPWLLKMGYMASFLVAKNWFVEWGFWALFIAGFSPVPYKVFTIAAGSMSMALLPFVVASLIGRSAQFFFIGAGIHYLGPKYEHLIRRYVEILGWCVVVAGVILYLGFKVQG